MTEHRLFSHWSADVNGVDVGTAMCLASFWKLLNNIPVVKSRRVLTAELRRMGSHASTHTADIHVPREDLVRVWIELAMHAVGEASTLYSHFIVGVSVHVQSNVVSLLLRDGFCSGCVAHGLRDLVGAPLEAIKVTALCLPLPPGSLGYVSPDEPYSPSMVDTDGGLIPSLLRGTTVSRCSTRCTSILAGSLRGVISPPPPLPSLTFTSPALGPREAPPVPALRTMLPVSLTSRCHRFYPIHTHHEVVEVSSGSY